MTICAIFDGRTQKECTRGVACRCEPECSVCEGTKKVSDGYEDWPCAHCNDKQELVSEGWVYELPNRGMYTTHFVCGQKPSDPRFLNLREIFSVRNT